MDKVTANPLIGPVPKYISTPAVIKVVRLASRIVEKARLKPDFTVLCSDFPVRNSSLIHSNIIIPLHPGAEKYYKEIGAVKK